MKKWFSTSSGTELFSNARKEGDCSASDSDKSLGCSDGVVVASGLLLDLGVLCLDAGLVKFILGGVAFGVVVVSGRVPPVREGVMILIVGLVALPGL